MVSSGVKCLFALSLVTFFQIGSCYKCYSCAGIAGSKPVEIPFPGLPITQSCLDPIDKSKIDSQPECAPEQNACVKISKIKDADVVIRACLPKETCDNFESCIYCQEDLCNASFSIYPSFALIGVITLVLVKLYL